MRRPIAALGSALFFLVAPGTAVGLIPWLLTRWWVREPLPYYYWAPMRVIGRILLVSGLRCVAPYCVPGGVRVVSISPCCPDPPQREARKSEAGQWRLVHSRFIRLAAAHGSMASGPRPSGRPHRCVRPRDRRARADGRQSTYGPL